VKIFRRGQARFALVIFLILLAVATTTFYILQSHQRPSTPRTLEVGDYWAYTITFPDGETYVLTESVKNITTIDGELTYLLFRDDPQHLSTEFIWITEDWREVRIYQPQIGNLEASVTVTYSPPIQLYRIPLYVGDDWIVNSTVTTLTQLENSRLQSTVQLIEERRVEAGETISTPAGSFYAFKVSASANGTLNEVTWFDTSIGQLVRGEYYNGREEVTQTLVSFWESASTANTGSVGLYALLTRAWKHFASYIYTKLRLLVELKIPYD